MYLLDRHIKIFRLASVGGNKTAMTTMTTSLESTIQPLGENKTAMFGGNFGKMFKIFIEADKDVKEGDQLRDYEGNIYKIVAGGLENRNDGFIADYMGIVCEKIN